MWPPVWSPMTESVFSTRLSSHAVPGRCRVVFGAAWTYLPACCSAMSMRRLWRRVDLPSAAFAAPPRVTVLSMITLTVAILTGSLVGRPVKNGDAHLKHTATEKTAAVPVAEAESTKVIPRSALRHREDHSRAPPGRRLPPAARCPRGEISTSKGVLPVRGGYVRRAVPGQARVRGQQVW